MHANEIAIRILDDARHRIADPDKWCNNISARTAKGDCCDVFSRQATQWCSSGSLEMSAAKFECRGNIGYPSSNVQRAYSALDAACLDRHNKPNIVYVNDTYGHIDSIRCFELAIEKLGGIVVPCEWHSEFHRVCADLSPIVMSEDIAMDTPMEIRVKEIALRLRHFSWATLPADPELLKMPEPKDEPKPFLEQYPCAAAPAIAEETEKTPELTDA